MQHRIADRNAWDEKGCAQERSFFEDLHPDFWADLSDFTERGVPAEFWSDYVAFMEGGKVDREGDLTTPPRSSALPPLFEEEGYTPPCVPVPTSKKALMASKRLEKELKSAKLSLPDETEEGGSSKLRKGSVRVKPSGKVDEKPSGKGEKPKPSKTRKAHDGPMTSAMKLFIQEMMNAGKTYRKAQKKWLKSAERASIVASVSQSERQRRRYT